MLRSLANLRVDADLVVSAAKLLNDAGCKAQQAVIAVAPGDQLQS